MFEIDRGIVVQFIDTCCNAGIEPGRHFEPWFGYIIDCVTHQIKFISLAEMMTNQSQLKYLAFLAQ